MKGSMVFRRPDFHRQPLSAAIALPLAAVLGVSAARGADQSSVVIEVSGTIAPRCSSGNLTGDVIPALSAEGGQHDLGFTVDCNAPFRYSLQSASGGFRASAASVSSRGFTVLVPYNVAITIPVNGARPIQDYCESRDIKAGTASCALSNSGPYAAIKQTGRLRVSWKKSDLPLLPGVYQDRLTVAFSLRP